MPVTICNATEKDAALIADLSRQTFTKPLLRKTRRQTWKNLCRSSLPARR
jgi:hypothetical protein